MINKIFALPVVEQITSTLSRRLMDELEVIVIDHPQVKASFALQGRICSPGNRRVKTKRCG
jgi:glucose-6-phosphate 1-epimerase